MLLKIINSIICIFVPGSSFLLTKRRLAAFAIPVIGITWVCIISWTRWVITPTGFAVMLLGLVFLHVVSYLIGLYCFKTNKEDTSSKTQFYGLFVLLIMLNIAITVSSHIKKAEWYGFAFYHIPSSSMAPTLLPGDVVFVDTWQYENNKIKIRDIIVSKKSATSLVMAKRVTNIQNINGKDEIFLEGDNSQKSTDSRSFGWIDQKYTIGKIKFVWFSFRKKDRFLFVSK